MFENKYSSENIVLHPFLLFALFYHSQDCGLVVLFKSGKYFRKKCYFVEQALAMQSGILHCYIFTCIATSIRGAVEVLHLGCLLKMYFYVDCKLHYFSLK